MSETKNPIDVAVALARAAKRLSDVGNVEFSTAVSILTEELSPPAEAPSEPSVEEERWAVLGGHGVLICGPDATQKQVARTYHPLIPFRVMVRSKAADDELKQQLADAINSEVDATEQLERERQSYETLVHEAVELRRQVSTLTRERDARYPEVVEFLDTVKPPWSISANLCEGKAGYVVEASEINGGTWFAGDTLAAACRTALDSVKERGDA